MGEETFRADYLILLLPHSSLCLVVISSSASNITLLQVLVLQRGRKQQDKLARVADFVRELGHIKRNDSVSGLNYSLPLFLIAVEGIKTRSKA